MPRKWHKGFKKERNNKKDPDLLFKVLPSLLFVVLEPCQGGADDAQRLSSAGRAFKNSELAIVQDLEELPHEVGLDAVRRKGKSEI